MDEDKAKAERYRDPDPTGFWAREKETEAKARRYARDIAVAAVAAKLAEPLPSDKVRTCIRLIVEHLMTSDNF